MIPWPAQHDCDAAGESARPAGGRDGRPSEQGKNFLMNDVPAGAASRSSSRWAAQMGSTPRARPCALAGRGNAGRWTRAQEWGYALGSVLSRRAP